MTRGRLTGLPSSRKPARIPRLHYAAIDWDTSWRLVPTRYPPVGLFDTVADPADLDAVFAIEAIGNPRLREQAGHLLLVPASERISGPGTTPIMAAFTHLNPEGSRFSDGTYGVYYAADALDTAIAEVAHHRARFLARTSEPPIDIDLRCYCVPVRATLVDLRGRHAQAELLAPDSYAASQAFGRARREAGESGIVHASVRHRGGRCVALFTPKATVPPATQSGQVTLQWNGQRIAQWYRKSEARAL
jgi:hypothetical protein